MTAMDLSELSEDRLKSLIENHQRKRAYGRPLYREAVLEWNRRRGGGLDLDKTLDLVRAAASERRFLSHREIADASEVAWEKARTPMRDHLWALVREARAKGWPMLSAIIVTKPTTSGGAMQAATLKGFLGAAEQLGYTPGEPETFLREQQELCFAWGAAPA